MSTSLGNTVEEFVMLILALLICWGLVYCIAYVLFQIGMWILSFW